MAVRESTVSALSLAAGSNEKASAAYELALELRCLLDAIIQDGDGRSPMSLFAFSLQRMAERACNAADVACGESARVLAAIQGESKSAIEA